MTRQVRGTVREVHEDADYIVMQTPEALGDRSTVTTIPVADIVKVGT